MALANLITKTDFDAKLSSLNRKITQNKTKHLLVGNELKNLKTFDSSYYIGNYIGTRWRRWYTKLFKVNTNDYALSWKSKGLSDKSIRPPTTSDNSLTPILNYYGMKTKVYFDGDCLK